MVKKKKNASIFQKLIISYVLFALEIVAVFFASVLIIITTITQGSPGTSNFYNVETAQEAEQNISQISTIGGWIEELNDLYEVQAVYGNKLTENTVYSENDIFDLISNDQVSTSDYIAFINNNETNTGYYMIIYNRDDVTYSTTINITNENTPSVRGWIFVVIFLVLFIGICILFGSYLARRIRKPLRLINEGMSKFTDDKNDTVLDFEAEAEFANIRDTFNQMTYDIKKANDEKEEAEKKKHKMLLELSHDIKTPISTINSFAIALEEGVVAEEDKEKYYHTIHQKADRVNGLTEGLFTLLKVQSSEYKLDRSKKDLCEFLRVICSEYYQDASENGLLLEADIPNEVIEYNADYILMERVITNLLSNAIKYNKTGKSIEVAISSTENITITVSDDGEPISDSIRNTLFDDFVRADESRSSVGGTGIGLSIAKAIVERHGGKIEYKNVNDKNGFIITLIDVKL
ncbi:MAG: ATP-binding protein [Suipraeoptans sp.]